MGRNTEINNNPEDVHLKRVGYDVKCSDKIIEVKSSTEKKIPFFTLNDSNAKALEESDNYFVYVVYDINNEPKLLRITKEYIHQKKKI